MKKWMFLIFPGAMLGIFLVFFLSHTKEAEAREKVRLEVLAKKIADDNAQKKADEDRARADAEKHATDRAAEDAKKEAERTAKQAAFDQDIKDAADKALAEGGAFQKTIDRLESELDQVHKQQDQLSRDNFDAAKQVELAKVARRTAELEIQRTVALVERKAQETYLTRLPPPPPPPKS
jgi:hypothetical protein